MLLMSTMTKIDRDSECLYKGPLTRNNNVTEPQQGVGEGADIEGRASQSGDLEHHGDLFPRR